MPISHRSETLVGLRRSQTHTGLTISLTKKMTKIYNSIPLSIQDIWESWFWERYKWCWGVIIHNYVPTHNSPNFRPGFSSTYTYSTDSPVCFCSSSIIVGFFTSDSIKSNINEVWHPIPSGCKPLDENRTPEQTRNGRQGFSFAGPVFEEWADFSPRLPLY